MTRSSMIRSATVGLLLCGCLASARGQDAKAFRFETKTADAYQTERAAAVAAAVGFATWPRTTELYVAPPVSRVLFGDPAQVSEEVRACTDVSIGDEPWPQCTWSWNGLDQERKVAREDWLDLEILVAPSARAAQEHVIGSLIDNQMPTEGLVKAYTAAARPASLGHAALVMQSEKSRETTARFLRGNVAVKIRGHGALAEEVLPLARRLDEQLAAQAPLNLDELRARTRAARERK